MVAILGGLSPRAFLRDYWQKRPLLVRQAIPGFTGFLDRDAVLGLAVRDDATSRLVIEHPRRGSPAAHHRDGLRTPRRKGAGHWERHDGPFLSLDASMLPARHWTVLVHGVESLLPGGWPLLRMFSFIPAARIDDLMVSYAADGGSVGPHDDLYDVFLLQGPGRRRWQVSTRGDHVVDPEAAIKVLANFVPEDEWLLEPGDMLYLPPNVAHYGVADGPCLTYSIGFLAPSHEALIQNFLGYLGEALAPSIDEAGIYQDPGLTPARDPLQVSDAMVAQVAGVLAAIRWDKAAVGEFMGRFLTGPKPRARFTPPVRPLAREAFARRLRGKGRLALALPTRGLTRRGQLFLNGEAHAVRPPTMRLFAQLVSERALTLPLALDERTLELFHGWYLAGYLTVRQGA